MSAFNLFDAVFDSRRAANVAILYEEREISYSALREETLRAAERLHALGITTGDRVAILLHDSPEFVTIFLGACALGAIAVPINTALHLDERRFILKYCEARAAIIEADACHALLDGASEQLPGLEDALIVSRDEDFDLPGVAGLKTQVWSEASRKPVDNSFPVRLSDDAPAFVLYTSGSTGEPKGAIHRQADIAFTVENYCKEALQIRPGDRIFSSSRLPFAYGLGNSLSFPLLNGASVILCKEKPLPDVISQIFSRYRPTIFFGVPVVYSLLLDHCRQGKQLECSSLRLAVSAGEALPAQIGEEWQHMSGVEVLDGIGSTEMLHVFISNREGAVRYGSSGQVVSGYDARLLDQEGSLTSEGEAGNLWVRGASAASGYWQRPAATAQTFVDGWVRTGDLYRRDGDGYYYHMGRSDDCFKSSGKWVSPVEVEGALRRHHAMREVAVVEGFDENGLSCVCAFVIAQDGTADGAQLEEELRQLAASALPRFKRPRRYMQVTALPHTATGKIQRFKLREQLRTEVVTR